MTTTQAEQMAARLTRVWGVPCSHSITGDEWLDTFTLQNTVVLILCSDDVLRIHIECHGKPLDESQLPENRGEIFKRNSWLSGVPIEASAHEKIEWIQGFTRGEIESWNLHF